MTFSFSKKTFLHFSFLGLLAWQNHTFAETCTGTAPPPAYLPASPPSIDDLDFAVCPSRCGYFTPPPLAWGWTYTGGFPNRQPDNLLPTYGYTNMTITEDDYAPAPKNVEYLYDPTPGPNSVVGIYVFVRGTGYSDLWLKTNRRVIHVGGGWLIKCRNNADGGNKPYIIVANGEIRVGWQAESPLAPGNSNNGAYTQTYPLLPAALSPSLPAEIPLSFNVSTTAGGAKVFYFGYPPPVYVDSGLRVRGKTKTYALAAEAGPIVTSLLRIQKNGKPLGIALVDVADKNASPVTVRTKSGIKAIRNYP